MVAHSNSPPSYTPTASPGEAAAPQSTPSSSPAQQRPVPGPSASWTSAATTLPPYSDTAPQLSIPGIPDTAEHLTCPTLAASDIPFRVGPVTPVPEGVKALEMRQRLAQEELRLKREEAGPPPVPYAAKHKFRMLQLRRDARGSAAPLAEPARRVATAGLFKQVCSTDLLFLMDTTSSMAAHITAAKRQVKDIVSDIKEAFLNEAEVRIAVVGYKDHCNSPNIQFLDFTTSTDQVHAFLSQLQATGGGDEPEDVLGGFRTALNASWRHQTRCIIHIADAPPHGRTLHDLPEANDNYPNPGTEPHGLTHAPLFQRMRKLSINYALLRINRTTDKMAWIIFQVYAASAATAGGCKLHASNCYYPEVAALAAAAASASAGAPKKGVPKGGLLFEEALLGTTYSELRHLVVKNVALSASRTAVRMSASIGRTASKGKLSVSSSGFATPSSAASTAINTPDTSNLGALVEEDEDAAEAVEAAEDASTLETVAPQWEVPGWLNETLVVEGFTPDVAVHGAGTLDDMMAADGNIKMAITELTVHKRARPFAQGALRVASYARTGAAPQGRFVVKSFKKGGKRLAHLAEDMRCQALCKAFALEFNALLAEEQGQRLDFVVTTCLKAAAGDECLSLEPFIKGSYVKYNNNYGYVNEDDPSDRFNQAAQAFSHFTFERSKGRFLVADLQGVGHVLTDPAIHTLDPDRFRLADTNLGTEGFKFFFYTHACNSLCHTLGLKSTAAMVMANKFDFRADWPPLDQTACCANKLCGRIVRLARAHRAPEFPNAHWCDNCWPQLRESMGAPKTIACTGPGPRHEFTVCDFFEESQGRVTRPQRCLAHRDKEETVAGRTEGLGMQFWNRLRFATKKKVVAGKKSL